MAVADWYAAQKDIEATLKAAPTLSKADIYTGGVPDAFQYTRPYVVLKFAGNSDQTRNQGITGAKDNSFNGQFTTASVSTSDASSRQLSQLVRNVLIGLVPNANCGEITPAFFAGVGEISSLTNPTRYSADQAYEVTVNATL